MTNDLYPIRYMNNKKRPKKNNKALLWALIFSALILFAGWLSSCSPKYTEQKAVGEVQKAYTNYKTPTLNWLRDVAPCVPTGSVAPEIKTDSAAYKKWKAETDSIVNSYEVFLASLQPEIIIDSANCDQQRLAYQRNAVKAQSEIGGLRTLITQLQNKIANTKAIHDTIPKPYPVKDMAEIIPLQDEVAAVKKSNKVLEGKVSAKNKWILWLIIACAVLALLNYIQFRKR